MSIAKASVVFLILWGNVNGGWLERKAEGWAWYEEFQTTDDEEMPLTITTETPTEKLAKARKQLEERLADAIINPTTENVKKYMEEQQMWIMSSAKFSQAWAKVLLQSPQLDPTATTFATSQYGRQLQKTIASEEKENLIKSVSKKYGLFFFYEGSSKVSKAFAEVVKTFITKYEWKAVAISIDGILLNEVANSKINNGAAEKMNITIFPALVAVNPKNQEVVPVAFGLQALDQIENNLFNQIRNNME